MSKRLLTLAVVLSVAVFGAVTANATTFVAGGQTFTNGVAYPGVYTPGTLAGTAVGFTWTDTSFNASYDKIVLAVTSIGGTQAGFKINIMEGNWAAINSAFSMAGDAAVTAYNADASANGGGGNSWHDWTLPSKPTFDAGSGPVGLTSTDGTYGPYQSTTYNPGTGINFPVTTDGYNGWGRVAAGDGIAADFSSFAGSWNDGSNALKDWGAGNTFATLYVKKGWNNVEFTGGSASGIAYTSGGGSVDIGAKLDLVTPEPTTLALLASGLVGLLAYAWRKRK